MTQFKKFVKREAYRTPTPFPESVCDSGDERTTAPESVVDPPTRKAGFKLMANRAAIKPVDAYRARDAESSDGEVEFVGDIRPATNKDAKIKPASRDSKFIAAVKERIKARSALSAIDYDSDVQLEPSPVIVDKPRTVKERPKPVPIFRKSEVKKSADPTEIEMSDTEPAALDSDHDANDRTPRPSRVLFVDNETTPVARVTPPHHTDADLDATPKAHRAREDVDVDGTGTVRVAHGRQTRAANGITKKRVLQDAAILSSDDDLPAHITPKKFKGNPFDDGSIVTRASPTASRRSDDIGSDEEYDDMSASKLEPIDLGITKRGSNASSTMTSAAKTASKGKKSAASDESEDTSNNLKERTADYDDVFASDLALATRLSAIDYNSRRISRSSGNPSSGTSKSATDYPAGRLHPDEIASIDAAMRKTRDDAIKAASVAKSAEAAKYVEVVEAAQKVDASKIADAASISAKNGVRFAEPSERSSAVDSSIRASASNPAFSVSHANLADRSASTALSSVSGRRTFKDMVKTPGKTPIMNSGPVLLDDTMKFRVPSLPARCDVTRAHLQDSLLAEDYVSLPNLRLGALRPWNAPPGSGSTMISVWFSGWAEQCPNLDFETACAIMRMQKYKNFVNPSRVSPMDVNILYTSHDNKRSILQASFKTAVCLSPILTRDSYLLEPTTTGLRNKYLSGHFHHQEWERFEAFACMVFDKKVMTAQIRDGAISFTTMGNARGDRDMSSPNRPPRNPSMLSAASSRGQSVKSRVAKPDANIRSVLDVSDDIPVYDARGIPFDFNTDLDHMEERLPKWIDEIPSHSFAVVGFTMGHYEKENRANLTTNILFAVLLATEGSDD